MTSAVILSICFTVAALILLIVMILVKADIIKRFRAFFVANVAIYLSGTVLILIVCLLMKNMPLTFSLISESLISIVFLLTFLMMYFVARKVPKEVEALRKMKADQLTEDNEQYKEKTD